MGEVAVVGVRPALEAPHPEGRLRARATSCRSSSNPLLISVSGIAKLPAMKRISPSLVAAALALIMLPSSGLQAGVSNKNGNPFGNGTFFSNTGTFEGVLRGTNLWGVASFTTDPVTNSSYTGGPMFLYWLGGNGTNPVSTNSTNYSPVTSYYDDTLSIYANQDPSSQTLNAFIAPSTNFPAWQAGANTNGMTNFSTNISLGGGYFVANMTVTPPNQTFSGSGAVNEIIDIVNGYTTNLPFVISGTRIGD